MCWGRRFCASSGCPSSRTLFPTPVKGAGRRKQLTTEEERSPISLDSPQRAGSQLLIPYLVPAGAPPSDGKEVTLSHARLLQNHAQRTCLERSSTRGFPLIWSADIFPFERIDPTFSEDVF